MTAYYNEIDPYAAQWTRKLIAAGCIAPGDVDTRSIEDVRPDDLRGYAQCHFFAGIGVWSYALWLAGVPDSMPVWTGSCPCQPFSAAGKGGGFADERHLWPAWHHLILQCRPAIVFGEQVASKAAEPWLDLVQDDLEALGYAFGAVPFPSASVGAPHIRDRLYWVADANGGTSRQGSALDGGRHTGSDALAGAGSGRSDVPCELADDDDAGLQRRIAVRSGTPERLAWSRGVASELADANGRHTSAERQQRSGQHGQQPQDSGAVRGFWANAEWLPCRDNKWRPVEPGTFPLAHGAPARMGRLRAYGNAINAEAARVFIESVMECRP